MNAAAVITLFVALTVPPLNDAQRAQLSTTGDFDEQFDQGALYPLLHVAAPPRLRRLSEYVGRQVEPLRALLRAPGRPCWTRTSRSTEA